MSVQLLSTASVETAQPRSTSWPDPPFHLSAAPDSGKRLAADRLDRLPQRRNPRFIARARRAGRAAHEHPRAVPEGTALLQALDKGTGAAHIAVHRKMTKGSSTVFQLGWVMFGKCSWGWLPAMRGIYKYIRLWDIKKQ